MAPPDFLFQTERLAVRPSDPTNDEDVRISIALSKTKGFRKAIGDSATTVTFEDQRALIQQRWDHMWKPHGLGTFMIFERPTSSQPTEAPRAVGQCSMVREAKADYPDVGYALFDEYVGKGYATEAVAGLIQHNRTHRGITNVTGYTKADNGPSRKVLERLGMLFVATVTIRFRGADQETVVYALGEDAQGRDEAYYRNVVQERLTLIENREKKDGNGS